MPTDRICLTPAWHWRSCSRKRVRLQALGRAPSCTPRPQAPPPRKRRGRVDQPAKASCACCRPMPSPNIRSTHRAGKLTYTATAGTLPSTTSPAIRAPRCSTPPIRRRGANRPLTFAFNGGPGAASAYLHLGLVGPRILELGPMATTRARELARQSGNLAQLHRSCADRPDRHRLEPRRQSRGRQTFWSVSSDADAMAKAISLYVANNNRAGSPKFLLGESYGGFRAAKIGARAAARPRHRGFGHRDAVAAAGRLADVRRRQFGAARGAAIAVAGGANSNAKCAYARALAAAEKFAMTDYLATLAGPPPQGDAGKAFYGRVAQMSGLPEDAVTQARGFAPTIS